MTLMILLWVPATCQKCRCRAEFCALPDYASPSIGTFRSRCGWGIRIRGGVGIRQSGSDFNEGMHTLAGVQISARHLSCVGVRTSPLQLCVCVCVCVCIYIYIYKLQIQMYTYIIPAGESCQHSYSYEMQLIGWTPRKSNTICHLSFTIKAIQK